MWSSLKTVARSETNKNIISKHCKKTIQIMLMRINAGAMSDDEMLKYLRRTEILSSAYRNTST